MHPRNEQCCNSAAETLLAPLQNGSLLQLRISADESSAEQLFGSDMTAVLQRYLKHESKALHDAAKGLQKLQKCIFIAVV